MRGEQPLSREELGLPEVEKKPLGESVKEFQGMLRDFLSFQQKRVEILGEVAKGAEEKKLKADLQDLLTRAEGDIRDLEQMGNEVTGSLESLGESLGKLGDDLREIETNEEFRSSLTPEQRAFFEGKPEVLKPIEIRFEA